MNLLPEKIRQRLPSSGSLTQRLMSASGWSAGGEVTLAVLRLGSNLITTRLLFPEAFSLIAIVLTVQELCTMLTDLGIARSIIRDPEGEDPWFLQRAWTLQAMVLLVIAFAMFGIGALVSVIGPAYAPAASVFADPLLPGLIMFTALTPLISIGVTPAVHVALRRLQQKQIVKCNLLIQFSSTSLTLVILYFYPSVWVLALGVVLTAATRVLVTKWMFPYEGLVLRPALDWEFLRKQWDFGKYLIVSSMLAFLYRRGDKLILGGLLDARTFGFYVIAMVWVESVRLASQKIINQVGFAAISEIVRQRPERLPPAFGKFMAVMAALHLTAAAGICLVGPYMIEILYTEEYSPVGKLFALLGLILLFDRFQALGSVKIAQGNTRAVTILFGARALGMMVMPFVGYWLGGPAGAIIGVVLAGAWGVPVGAYYLSEFMSLSYMRKQYLLIAVSFAVIAGVTYFVPIL